MKTSLLYILKRFNSTLTEISNLAEQVSSNSSEVENASKSLADGATEQAGVIEELNATIDTVVDMAEDTAKETQNASARVKASANKANEEKEKMNELLTEWSTLQKSPRRSVILSQISRISHPRPTCYPKCFH